MSGKRTSEGGVYTRTRKRLKASEYRGRATIHDLPVEVIWRIIDYLDHECMWRLRGVCGSVSTTLEVVFYHEYRSIPAKIESVKRGLLERLVSGRLSDDAARLDLTKSLLYLNWLETELVIFEAVLRRHDPSAESDIFTGLWSAAREIRSRIDCLTEGVPLSELLADCRVLNPPATLPAWCRLMESLDEEVESSSPFEIQLLDILCCCPSSNMALALRRPPGPGPRPLRLAAFFQIQDSCSDRSLPEFPCESTDRYEKAVLRFLRSVVRTRNSLFVSNLYSDIRDLEWRLVSSFVDDTDRGTILARLQDKYARLSGPHYEPLYFSRDLGAECYIKMTTMDVSNNFVECVLEEKEVGASDVPLIAVAPSLFATKERPSAAADCRRLLDGRAGATAPFRLTVLCKRWGENKVLELTRHATADHQSTVFSLVVTPPN